MDYSSGIARWMLAVSRTIYRQCLLKPQKHRGHLGREREGWRWVDLSLLSSGFRLKEPQRHGGRIFQPQIAQITQILRPLALFLRNLRLQPLFTSLLPVLCACVVNSLRRRSGQANQTHLVRRKNPQHSPGDPGEGEIYSITGTFTHAPSFLIDSFPFSMTATFSTISRKLTGASLPSKNFTIPSTKRV